jgi:hypothetical protein
LAHQSRRRWLQAAAAAATITAAAALDCALRKERRAHLKARRAVCRHRAKLATVSRLAPPDVRSPLALLQSSREMLSMRAHSVIVGRQPSWRSTGVGARQTGGCRAIASLARHKQPTRATVAARRDRRRSSNRRRSRPSARLRNKISSRASRMTQQQQPHFRIQVRGPVAFAAAPASHAAR